MSQRLDDVTGRVLAPLSAQQREQQRAQMVSTLNAVIAQCNVLTAAVHGLQLRADAHDGKLVALETQVAWLSRPSWWARVWRRVGR